MITQLTGFFLTAGKVLGASQLSNINIPYSVCVRKTEEKCPPGKRWVFLGFWKKTKGLHLTLLSHCQGVWPLPTIHSFFSFLSLSPFIFFPYLLPVGGKMLIMPIKERSSSTGRKYLRDSNIELTIELPTHPPPLLRPTVRESLGPGSFGLWFGSTKPQNVNVEATP